MDFFPIWMGLLLTYAGGNFLYLIAQYIIETAWLKPEQRAIDANLRDPIVEATQTLDIEVAYRKVRAAHSYLKESGLKADFRDFSRHLYRARQRLSKKRQSSQLRKEHTVLWVSQMLRGDENLWPVPKRIYTHRVKLANTISDLLMGVGAIFNILMLVALGSVAFVGLLTAVDLMHYH